MVAGDIGFGRFRFPALVAGIMLRPARTHSPFRRLHVFLITSFIFLCHEKIRRPV
jgi:hypothetical protein